LELFVDPGTFPHMSRIPMGRAAGATLLGVSLIVALKGLSTAAPALPAPPEPIPSPAAPGSAEPNLTVGPDETVYLSWLEPADSGFALRFSSLDGVRWRPAATIRTGRDFFVNWADFPSLEVMRGGQLVAHWLQRTGSNTYAYGVRLAVSRDRGRTWSAPIRPHVDSSNTEHGFVSLWRDGDGVGAVWLDGRKFNKEGHSPSNEMTLMSATFGADGAVRTHETVLDQRVCDCCQTAAAMTSAGPVIVYRDRSPDEVRDMYVVRREEALSNRPRRWTSPVAVHADGWKVNYCPVNGPAIAADGKRVAVAWFTAASDSPRVKLAFSNDAGASFATPVRVDEGNPAGRVDVAMLRNGDALVSWIERTGGDTAAVRVRRIRANGRAEPPVTIASSSAARASGFPRMALTNAYAIFAWTAPGRPSQVQVARIALKDLD
jgi:hypothetical protein